MAEFRSTCRVCKQPKPPGYCRPCRNKYRIAYEARNRDRINERHREFRKRHATELSLKQKANVARLAKVRQRRLENIERERARVRRWEKANPANCAARVARRTARKLRATPSWLTPLDLAYIDLIYALGRWKSVETGVKHAVDHIYPLRGKTVTGLHVPANLRIITAAENLAKGNRVIEFL